MKREIERRNFVFCTQFIFHMTEENFLIKEFSFSLGLRKSIRWNINVKPGIFRVRVVYCQSRYLRINHQLIVRLFSLRIFEQKVSTTLDLYKHQALAIIKNSANGLSHLSFSNKV